VSRIAAASLLTLVVAAPFPAALHAQAYPSKPIRYIVPFPPGGGSELIARAVAQKAGEALGVQVLEQGAEAATSTPEQLAAFLKSEIALYAGLVRKSGMRAD
jgi:tripartite-type tricarboxylate transporter receptor subunit TctC